jgi:hypothetical protein
MGGVIRGVIRGVRGQHHLSQAPGMQGWRLGLGLGLGLGLELGLGTLAAWGSAVRGQHFLSWGPGPGRQELLLRGVWEVHRVRCSWGKLEWVWRP